MCASDNTPMLKSDLRGIETVLCAILRHVLEPLKSDLRGIETYLSEQMLAVRLMLKSDLRGIETLHCHVCFR